MSETISNITDWIWINTPDAGIHRPGLARPSLPIGERLLHPILDYLERTLGSKDILFQIRDQLFDNAEVLIKKTRSIRYLNLRADIILCESYIQSHVARLPNKWGDTTIDETPLSIGPVIDSELISSWLRQQFATWALIYHREISPLIHIHVNIKNIKEHFQVEGPVSYSRDPKAKFQMIAPYSTCEIVLKPSDFEKTYCDIGLPLIEGEVNSKISRMLPLVSDHHIRMFWDIQPWIVHTGEHETWLLSGPDEAINTAKSYGGWRMLPDNAFVPLSSKNIILLGRVTRYHDGIQPVRGSLMLRYLGV